MKNYSTLLLYREEKAAKLDVLWSIRPLIEGIRRVYFPEKFPANEWLGGFIKKFIALKNYDGLSHAKPDLAEIEAINEFSKKYHHKKC